MRNFLLRATAAGILTGAVTLSAALAQNPFSPPAPVPSAPQYPQQQYPQQQVAPQNQQSSNPICIRLESQLAAIDRGQGDPGRMAQSRRIDDTVNRLQADLDRLVAQQRRLGCQNNGFFSIFTSQPPQCSGLNNQVDQTRQSLDNAMNESQRLQAGGTSAQESQRQGVLLALSQNNCGPQYANAGQTRGLFDNLFGGNRAMYGGVDVSQGGTYTTLCVRTCDGYYYPISFATNPSRFADDEATCRATCPNADVALYTRRTNEDIRTATSISGRPYTELPNAFRYRQQFDAACSCRKAGQSWAEALGQTKDNSVQSGDIVVTDEKAKALSQPKQGPRAVQQNAPAQAGQQAAPGGAASPIRSVGPASGYPTR
jgi:hypothetical protein